MGADYRKSQRSLILGTSPDQTNVNQTRYICPGGGPLHATVIRAETFIDVPGIIRGLRAHSHNAPGAGETYDYTLMVNGLASVLTCQTAGAVATESSDLVNAVAVAPGDDIVIRIVTSLNAAIAYHTWGLEFRH